MGLFAQLNFNYTPTGNNEIITFSDETIKQLNAFPILLNDWQANAVADSTTSLYTKNPVANIVNSIISVAGSLDVITNAVLNIETIHTNANTLYFTTAPAFYLHSDRISGVVPPDANTADFPHYETAISTGKFLQYLLYQTDGIINNAPIMGNFTSILIANTLNDQYNTITGYANTINASISTILVGMDTVYTSNLAANTIAEINSNLSNIISTFDTRRTHDENFYNNSLTLIEKYDSMKKFSDIGTTEQNLLKNYLGTDELKNQL
jgi:hypothetical protein